jgi:hypothetical protein
MCGSGPQSAQYSVKDENTGKIVDRKIKNKDVKTISKWAKGAVARRKLTKLILTSVIGSKYSSQAFLFLNILLSFCFVKHYIT